MIIIVGCGKVVKKFDFTQKMDIIIHIMAFFLNSRFCCRSCLLSKKFNFMEWIIKISKIVKKWNDHFVPNVSSTTLEFA